MADTLVIFDCFGVIMNEVAPVFLKKFLPSDKADTIKEELFVPADMGEVTYEELLSNMAKVLGMTMEEMVPQWDAMFSLREEIVPVIRKIREIADVALLSNAPLGVVEGILDRYDLWDLFEHTVVSCNVKMAKPDVESINTAFLFLIKSMTKSIWLMITLLIFSIFLLSESHRYTIAMWKIWM